MTEQHETTFRDKLNKWAGPMCIILVFIAGVNMYNSSGNRDNKVERIDDTQICALKYSVTNGDSLKKRSLANDTKTRAQDDFISSLGDILLAADQKDRIEEAKKATALSKVFKEERAKADLVKKNNPLLDPPDCAKQKIEDKA